MLPNPSGDPAGALCPRRAAVRALVLLVLLLMVGAGGAGASSPAQMASRTFLPTVSRIECLPTFADSFGNANSGWAVRDTSDVRSEYRDGEFRILIKDPQFYWTYRAPECAWGSFNLQVDARWGGTVGFGYGLVFNLAPDYSSYYLFQVQSELGTWSLERWDGASKNLVLLAKGANTTGIRTGANDNRLRVERRGAIITMFLNGSMLWTVADSTYINNTGIGVVATPIVTVANADARFDDFQVGHVVVQGNALRPACDLSGDGAARHDR